MASELREPTTPNLETIMATLMNYATGEDIREATDAELAASVEAAKSDGGAGVIAVKIDGEEVSCYVVE